MSNSPLLLQYTKACEWIDAKPVRERALIALSAIALVFLIWNYLIQAPYTKKSLELKSQLSQLDLNKKGAQDQLTGLASAFATDPAKMKQQEIDQLNIFLKDAEDQLSGMSQSLIAAENLPQVLEKVFHQAQGLELISLKTLPVEEIVIAQIVPIEQVTEASSSSVSSVGNIPDPKTINRKVAQNQVKPKGSGVFKHGVVLQLRGDYFRVVALMKSLENLSWKFYWESLDYKVVQYPNAEIELRVFTLSSEEGLFGV